MADYGHFTNLIWYIADFLLRPYLALLKERRGALIAAPLTRLLDAAHDQRLAGSAK